LQLKRPFKIKKGIKCKQQGKTISIVEVIFKQIKTTKRDDFPQLQMEDALQ
jgi:hypothetical protein